LLFITIPIWHRFRPEFAKRTSYLFHLMNGICSPTGQIRAQYEWNVFGLSIPPVSWLMLVQRSDQIVRKY